MGPLDRLSEVGEQAAQCAAGRALSILGRKETTDLVRDLTSRNAVGALDGYRELTMMLLYGAGLAIQKIFPEEELHRPIMNQMVAHFSSALFNAPGAVTLAGARQDFLSAEAANTLNQELGLLSPTHSLVPSRFTAWFEAQSAFESGAILAHSSKLAELLGVPATAIGLLGSTYVASMFRDVSLGLLDSLLEFRKPMVAAVRDLQAQHGRGMPQESNGAGCAVVLFTLGAAAGTALSLLH